MNKFIVTCCIIILFLTLSFSQETGRMFKIPLIQMYVDPGNKNGNLDNAERLIMEAARNGAKVVLLPEAMDLGWTHPLRADVILSPSSWAVKPDHNNVVAPYWDTWRKAYITVAKEFAVWVTGYLPLQF